jgi:hypothetical protein
MHTVAVWANRHDYAKLILITLVMIPVMFVAVAAASPELFSSTVSPELFGPVVLGGMALCGVAAFWLGNWKWILIPLLAMLVEIAFAVPVTMRVPNAVETPISVVLESPFWAGIPTLIGAGVGYLVKRAYDWSRRRHQATGMSRQ